MLSDFIYKNKKRIFPVEHLDNALEDEMMTFVFTRIEPLTVLTKEENDLDIFEKALKEECLFFPEFEEYKYSYSKRDIILSLMEHMPSFLKEFFVAAECKKSIKKEKNIL